MEFLGVPVLVILKIFVAAFTGILFTQSGLDKLFDYTGNLQYLRDYFKKSVLAGTADLLLPTITLLEVASGLVSLLGVGLLFFDNELPAFYGLLLSSITLLGLFTGQRLAKDYQGAAGLVPYFLLITFGIYLYVGRL